MREIFRHIASSISVAAGRASTFLLAVLVIVVWALSGRFFDYSDTWQLVINTGTTIVTFLMVFLIQNTQNRDSKAVQIKLDELIRATRANNSFIDIEDLSDDELSKLSERFSRLHEAEGGKDPALEKLNKQINVVLNKRVVSIPGEEHVTKYLPFTEHGEKRPKK